VVGIWHELPPTHIIKKLNFFRLSVVTFVSPHGSTYIKSGISSEDDPCPEDLTSHEMNTSVMVVIMILLQITSSCEY
jgi:hypothetical protein